MIICGGGGGRLILSFSTDISCNILIYVKMLIECSNDSSCNFPFYILYAILRSCVAKLALLWIDRLFERIV